MTLQATIGREEDGAWIVECPATAGCVSQATTRDQALANIQDAIRECPQVRAEQRLPLTPAMLIVANHPGLHPQFLPGSIDRGLQEHARRRGGSRARSTGS